MWGITRRIDAVLASLAAIHAAVTESANIKLRVDGLESVVRDHDAQWRAQMADAEAMVSRAQSDFRAARRAEERTKRAIRANGGDDAELEEEYELGAVDPAHAAFSGGPGVPPLYPGVESGQQFVTAPDELQQARLLKTAQRAGRR